ncbi:hypothetical protein JCM10207_002392 [Rhodosporidiobolus poonsookiae]
MEAAMAALKSNPTPLSPPSNGQRAVLPSSAHPYAATVGSNRLDAPLPPPPSTIAQNDANFAAQLGGIMLTPEDQQEGYDSALAYLPPRSSPPNAGLPNPPGSPPPTQPAAPPTTISPSVPRFQLSDGPVPSSAASAAVPPVAPSTPLPAPPAAAHISYHSPPSRAVESPLSPGHAPLPPSPPAGLPLPESPPPASGTGLARSPSLTISSHARAADADALEPQYRAHDSPMPFRSFDPAQDLSPAYGLYPRRPPSDPRADLEPQRSLSPPPPSIDVLPPLGVSSSSEKIWRDEDEVDLYKDIDGEGRKKKMWKMAGFGLVALAIIIAVAVAVGVSVSKKSGDDKADSAQLQASSSGAGASFLTYTPMSVVSGSTRPVTATSTLSTSAESSSTKRGKSTSASSASSASDSTSSSDVATSTTSSASRMVTTTRASTTQAAATTTAEPTTESSASSVGTSVVAPPASTTRATGSSSSSSDDDDDEDDDSSSNSGLGGFLSGLNPFSGWSSHHRRHLVHRH